MVVMGGDDVGCTGWIRGGEDVGWIGGGEDVGWIGGGEDVGWIGGGEDELIQAEMVLEQHLVEVDLHQ
ncbi:hypothetical protein Tco_0416297 [Tanacetum coccineum]